MRGGAISGLVRLSAEQARARLAGWAVAIGTIVDPDGRPVDDPVQLSVTERKPLAPAPVELPVSSSATLGEIRSEGAATAAAVSFGYVDEHAEVQAERGKGKARLKRLRRRLRAVGEQITTVETERSGIVARLPGRMLRRVGQRPSKVAALTPWAMFLADFSLMANPYGVFGAIALPFPTSAYVGNATQLLRAAAVAYGLTFGLKLVGGKARELSEDVRERHAVAGMAADGGVVFMVVATAFMLAQSAAQLQAAFLAVASGAGTVSVPTSVLVWIVVFLGSVSFATGYFSSEPELARIAQLDGQLNSLRETRDTVDDLVAAELGGLLGLRARERAVAERERLDLEEQARHTERSVYVHLGSDTPVYGVEFDSDEARVPGAKP